MGKKKLMRSVDKEKFANNKNFSFVGLRQILKIVINSTHDDSFKHTKQERLEKVINLLFGKPLPGKGGHPETEFIDPWDSGSFFRLIRDEILASKKTGRIVTPTQAIRKHIEKVVYNTTAEHVIDNLVKRYNEEAKHLENPEFLEQRESADKAMAERIHKSWQNREKAIEEILSCLKKHNWPI